MGAYIRDFTVLVRVFIIVVSGVASVLRQEGHDVSFTAEWMDKFWIRNSMTREIRKI